MRQLSRGWRKYAVGRASSVMLGFDADGIDKHVWESLSLNLRQRQLRLRLETKAVKTQTKAVNHSV
jgi:hypothetical protein